MKARLDSVKAIIDALGGNTVVGDLIGVSSQAVWNWKKRNRFSARTFAEMTEILEKHGYEAERALWGQM